jgi:hypothetical protein
MVVKMTWKYDLAKRQVESIEKEQLRINKQIDKLTKIFNELSNLKTLFLDIIERDENKDAS